VQALFESRYCIPSTRFISKNPHLASAPVAVDRNLRPNRIFRLPCDPLGWEQQPAAPQMGRMEGVIADAAAGPGGLSNL
jgi:hypothetical protein